MTERIPTKQILEQPMRATWHVDLAPESYDPDTNTIRIRWYAGAVVPRYPIWEDPYTLQLGMLPGEVILDRLNNGVASLTVDHSDCTAQVIGRAVPGSAEVIDGVGYARFALSTADCDVDSVHKVRTGILGSVSVEADIRERTITQIDGRPDAHYATLWEPTAVSVVATSADPNAVVLAADRGDVKMADRQIAPESATHPVQAISPAPPAISDADLHAAVASALHAERARTAAIDQQLGHLGRLNLTVAPEIVAGLKSSDRSPGDAAYELLAHAQARAVQEDQALGVNSHHTSITREQRDTRLGLIESELLGRMSSGRLAADRPREHRGDTSVDLVRHWGDAVGVDLRHMDRMESVGKALTHLTHTTSDFPLILANAANKVLGLGYQPDAQTWRPLSTPRQVADFKTQSFLRLSAAPPLLVVPEGAEYHYGTLAEGRETGAVLTYGRLVECTRQMLINDELDAFGDLLTKMGSRVASMESDVWWSVITTNAAMSDGIALYHANHANLAGAGGAPTPTTIGAAERAMIVQTGLAGEKIDIRPTYLVGPYAIKRTVEQFYSDKFVPTDETEVVTVDLQRIWERRLDDASATAWYLFAAPPWSGFVHLELQGQGGPTLEMEASFTTDAVRYKVRRDFGAAATDHRGTYRNAGA